MQLPNKPLLISIAHRSRMRCRMGTRTRVEGPNMLVHSVP